MATGLGKNTVPCSNSTCCFPTPEVTNDAMSTWSLSRPAATERTMTCGIFQDLQNQANLNPPRQESRPLGRLVSKILKSSRAMCLVEIILGFWWILASSSRITGSNSVVFWGSNLSPSNFNPLFEAPDLTTAFPTPSAEAFPKRDHRASRAPGCLDNIWHPEIPIWWI